MKITLVLFCIHRIHLELHQFSSQFIRNIETEMKLKCSQLVIDWQQQCLFVVHVNFSFERLIIRIN